MKRILAVLTVIILAFGMVGCGENNITESDENTGTVTGQQTESSRETSVVSSVNTPSSKPAGKKPQPKPQQPAHKHSYTKKVTPPTCTAKGFTTYTCTCGHKYDADYVNPSHNYNDYKCTKCGAVDKAHAYEYLVSWVKKNGKTDGMFVDCDEQQGDVLYRLSFDAQYEKLGVNMITDFDNQHFNSILFLDSCFYAVQFAGAYANGYLKAAEFTENSPIAYNTYEGDENLKYQFIELSRQTINQLLKWLEKFLSDNNVGITLADLGFKKY